MRKETFRANYIVHKDHMSLHPSSLVFDLPKLAEKMKLDQNWARGEINSMVLLKTPDKQIVLTVLHDKTEIKSFQSNDSITFQIIEGKLKFHARNESLSLEKGQILTLHENIKYSLTTLEETILLLIIANGTLELSKN